MMVGVEGAIFASQVHLERYTVVLGGVMVVSGGRAILMLKVALGAQATSEGAVALNLRYFLGEGGGRRS